MTIICLIEYLINTEYRINLYCGSLGTDTEFLIV